MKMGESELTAQKKRKYSFKECMVLLHFDEYDKTIRNMTIIKNNLVIEMKVLFKK